MKSPTRSSHTMWFLAISSIAWLGVAYAIAFFVFEVSPLAAWGITAGIGIILNGAIAYLAWEFRRARHLPSHESAGHLQDVSLLLLRSTYAPRHHQPRRTRSRLCGQNPVTDRIISFHRPPHADRRIKIRGRQAILEMGPFLDHPKSRTSITPSVN